MLGLTVVFIILLITIIGLVPLDMRDDRSISEREILIHY